MNFIDERNKTVIHSDTSHSVASANRDEGGKNTPFKLSKSKSPPPAHGLGEKIVKAFNTWAFKREQPDSLDLLLRQVCTAVEAGVPVPFILYWGKGPRSQVAPVDLTCLDYLAAFAKRIGDVYQPGAALRLIQTDTHARLNGHSEANITSYYDQVTDGARERGFETVRLSTVVASAGLGSDEIQSTGCPRDMFGNLVVSASKWYRGEGSVEDGARTYYAMNMVEKRALELVYPSAIFLTFNGSDARLLFPDHLPVFFMYSLRRGFSVKPWFLPAEGGEMPAPGRLD